MRTYVCGINKSSNFLGFYLQKMFWNKLTTYICNHVRPDGRLSAGEKYRVVRQNMSEFLQYGRIVDKSGRGVKSEPNSASATPMDVDANARGKVKGCFVW